MKVLIGVRNISFGGAEILECRLAVALNQKGIHADLLSQYNLNDFDTEGDRKAWLGRGVPSIEWLNAKGAFGLFFSIFRLAKLIRKNKYDYVITTNTGLDSIAALAKLICKFRHVVALHFYPPASLLKSIRFKLRQVLIQRSSYKMYAISRYVKQENLKYLSYDEEKIFVIYNSISKDQQSFVPGNNDQISKELGTGEFILFVGRIMQSKGIDKVLEVFSRIAKDTANIALVVLGDAYNKGIEDGIVGYKNEVLSLINKLNLMERVIFLGRRKDVIAIMQKSKLLIHLPSNEGFGLVLVEAISANIPVVASNIGGIPEIISKTPYSVFDLDDLDGIELEVRKYLTMDESSKNSITTKARECLEFYSDQRRSQEVIDLILA